MRLPIQKGRTSPAQRVAQNIRPHSFDAEFALFGSVPLAFFLSPNIRYIRLLDAIPRQYAFQIIPDHKARSIAIRQDNQPACLRDTPQQLQPVLVMEDTEAAGL